MARLTRPTVLGRRASPSTTKRCLRPTRRLEEAAQWLTTERKTVSRHPFQGARGIRGQKKPGSALDPTVEPWCGQARRRSASTLFTPEIAEAMFEATWCSTGSPRRSQITT